MLSGCTPRCRFAHLQKQNSIKLRLIRTWDESGSGWADLCLTNVFQNRFGEVGAVSLCQIVPVGFVENSRGRVYAPLGFADDELGHSDEAVGRLRVEVVGQHALVGARHARVDEQRVEHVQPVKGSVLWKFTGSARCASRGGCRYNLGKLHCRGRSFEAV